MAEAPEKRIIYVSYSRRDAEWKDRIIRMLMPILDELSPGQWAVWVDSNIEGGQLWRDELTNAIKRASVGLLLVSPDFLNSPFILDFEVKNLLQRSEKEGTRIIPIIVRPTDWNEASLIADRQFLPRDAKPLSGKTDDEIAEEIGYLADIISRLPDNSDQHVPETPDNEPASDEQGPSGGQAGDEEAPTRSTDPDPELSELLPLSDLEKFRLSNTVESIVSEVTKGLYLPVPLSTSTIFFSIVIHGFESPRSHYDTISFVAELVNRTTDDAMAQRVESVINGYIHANTRSDIEQSWMTSTVFGVFANAKNFSRQLGDGGVIHARHLLASLINGCAREEKLGFSDRLDELSIPVTSFRDEFLDFIKNLGQGKDEVWTQFIFNKQEPPKTRVPRTTNFNADDARGESSEDWLQIDNDVNAFAALIASRTVSPPLSIGLFGEWGSGKTFFMRRLRKRVDKLAKEAQRSRKMQRDIPFYKRIAQIEFNAWHYAESNLWASLVEHIFSNLRVAGNENESAIEKLQKHLLDQFNVKKAAERQADEKVRAAENDFLLAQSNLEKVENELEKDSVKLNAELAKNLISEIELPEEVKKDISDLQEEMNLTKVGNDIGSFIGAAGEAKKLFDRGANLLTPLAKSKHPGWRLAFLIGSLVSAPLLIIGITLFKQYYRTEWFTEGMAILTGIATFLATIAAWIRSQAGWLGKFMTKAERSQQHIDKLLAEKELQNKAAVDALERQIDISKVKYEAALQEHEAAKQNVAAAWAEQRNSTAERLLAKFIEDRAASDDYRKHLGVLALVRNDFEKLSDIIDEQNQRLSPPDPNARPNRLTNFKSLREENKESETRINRIVLYIDDLDRCPPNKVVDVLQAVHLLLAFPLFVVVVGVDARWVTRSLEARYRELLNSSRIGARNGSGTDAREPATETLIGVATPDDYLEKIFQIPFWLNPMDEDARERMVQGLLKRDIVDRKKEVTETRPTVPSPQPRLMTAHGERVAITQQPDAAQKMTATNSSPSAGSGGQTDGAADIQDQPVGQPENLMDQPNLEILPEESDFMAEFYPLLGRSPRALKRFVNVYRLIKVGLSEEELESFTTQSGKLSDSQAVLFLLAVDTGAPSVSEKFFQMIRRIRVEKMRKSQTLSTQSGTGTSPSLDLDWILAEFKDENSTEWTQLISWLELRRHTWGDLRSLIRIGSWVPRVARYSFQSRKV